VDEPPARAPVCRFGPDRRLTAACVILSLTAALLAGITDDRAGRLLLFIAALILLGYAVTDLIFWPRIVASADGIELHSPLGSGRYPWVVVTAVRADTRQRLGLRSVTLEIDAGDELHVFSKRALGAEPAEVAGLIQAMDPRRR
jgi:hypothetical protein